MKLRKKLTTFAICLAIPCSALANNVDNDCQKITFENMHEFIKGDTVKKVDSPFGENGSDNCVLMSYKTSSPDMVDENYFGGNKRVMGAYKDWLSSTDTSQVTMIYDKSVEKLYSFMHVDASDTNAAEYKRHWAKQKVLMANYEDFMFFHELMHLDADYTRSDMDRNEKEAIADTAAVMMISIKNDFSLSQTETLMSQMFQARRVKVPDHEKRGRLSVDKDHYNSKMLKNAISFFAEMEKNGKTLTMESLKEVKEVAALAAKEGADGVFNMDSAIASVRAKEKEKNTELASANFDFSP